MIDVIENLLMQIFILMIIGIVSNAAFLWFVLLFLLNIKKELEIGTGMASRLYHLPKPSDFSNKEDEQWPEFPCDPTEVGSEKSEQFRF